MAQVSFAKLAPKVSSDVKVINFNDQEIEVKQYLPVDQKLEAITNIINACVEDIGYYNPAKVEIYTVLETVYKYTNIKFTDKQKEDPKKLYDQIVGSGLWTLIDGVMSIDESWWLQDKVTETMNQVYKYRDSIYGILDAMKTDYSDMQLDIGALRDQLANADGLGTVKDVLDKLG